MIELLIEYVVKFISSIGYFGLFILMVAESTMIPLPSELVMPFAGFLVAGGSFSFIWALIFATLGSLVGSIISYYIGYYASGPAIRKFGKYFFLNEHHLKKSEAWFERRGKITIFLGRFVPGLRHVISIPAGVGKMDLLPFSLLTVLGAGIWNAILLYAGYILQRNWKIIYQYTSIIDWTVAAIVVIAIVGYMVYISRKGKR